MNTILIVDDDAYIRELVGALIADNGFQFIEARDGREALELINKHTIDLCILDVMMPNIDGFEFLKLARRYYDFPVLLLTAKSETAQKIKGFEMGADDYLTKPFEGAELVVRVRALLKRYKIAYAQSVQIGSLAVDRNRHAILYEGASMDIPMKEFDLLFLLGSYIGQTLARDRLIEEVWGYDFEGNERTLDVHINRLRERFPSEQYGFKITTIRGLGYRLETL